MEVAGMRLRQVGRFLVVAGVALVLVWLNVTVTFRVGQWFYLRIPW
jgi:hypothetical protein